MVHNLMGPCPELLLVDLCFGREFCTYKSSRCFSSHLASSNSWDLIHWNGASLPFNKSQNRFREPLIAGLGLTLSPQKNEPLGGLIEQRMKTQMSHGKQEAARIVT